jgi:hypothetical protein
MVSRKLKIFFQVMIVCTPLGWMWNWWHYKSSMIPAWEFTPFNTLGILIFGIPLVDWIFYPITGGFFATMVLFDLTGKKHNINIEMAKSTKSKKLSLILLTIWMSFFGVLIFGKSGTMTAVCYGIPSVFFLLYVFENINVYHFMRIGFIVIPTNFCWEIWATPITKQWYYNKDSFCFNTDFWFWGIPIEMTPYLGLMAWPFIYGIVETITKINYASK